MLDSKWIPMQWPCGPLEWARRNKSNNTTPELKTTLDAWAQPSSLDLLKGTPINCLVVRWADGADDDSAQQQALRPLIEAGSHHGIQFVGKVASSALAASADQAARNAGLSAIMIDKAATRPLALPAITQFSREDFPWDSTTPIFSSTGNEWPGLKLDSMKGDTAVAGPTGVPWVNSNAWFSLLSRELVPGKTVWLEFDPPASSTLAHPADYPLAVADSEVYGSHWIISLDDHLRGGLSKNDPQAAKIWRQMNETLAFYVKHSQWQQFQPRGVLAVVSDYRGDNAFMSGEILNLLNRRQVQFQVMQRSKALAAPEPALKAILWVDKEAPTDGQLEKLLAFVRQGNLIIAATYWGPAGVPPTTKDPSLDYKIYNIGQGQIAVTNEGFLDPYQVAGDTHLLVSRRHDLVRLYNPATTNCQLSFDPVHGRQLVQVVNYTATPASFITLWMNTRARQAQFWSPDAPGARSLTGAPASPGTEFELPTVTVNCALEIDS
jgi:hypothetical protein